MSLNFDQNKIIGRANAEITPEVAATLGAAIGTFYGKGSIFVASRDFRTDSRMLKRAVSSGLMSTGCVMIDMHSCPATATQFACRRFGATAGISVSSSHRAKDDVRIRIFDSSGVDISEEETRRIIDLMKEDKIIRVPASEIGWINPIEAGEIYKNAILGFINRVLISKASFRIVIDCSLGPTSLIVPNALSELKTEVISLNSYVPSGTSEVLPNPKSIQKMKKAVIATDSDLGVAFDTEGRQMAIVDETGRIYSTDEVASIILSYLAKKRDKGIIVLSENLTTRMDDYLKKEGFEIIREVDTSGSLGRRIMKERAYFGASDRGIFHFPSFGVSSDGILALFVLLETIAEGKKISELRRSLPTDVSLKREISFEGKLNQELVMQNLLMSQDYQTIDTLTGVKFLFSPGSWVHVRPGHHSYSFELIQESKENSSNNLFKKAEEILRKAINAVENIK